MQYTENRVLTGRFWLWLAISAIILLLASSAAAAQGRNDFYLAVGPALTSSSYWGKGHNAGYGGEIGILHPIGPSWDLVGTLSAEAFQLGDPPYDPFFGSGPSGGYGAWGPVDGGNDYLITVRGGIRRTFTTSTRLKPYLGALLGLSSTHQDLATAPAYSPGAAQTGAETRILQDNNNQVAPVFSAVLGVNFLIGAGYRVFVESGYSYVYTPDDSFDDNPEFFPLRVGVIF